MSYNLRTIPPEIRAFHKRAKPTSANELVNVQDRHRAMLRLLAQGMTETEVAKLFGCTPKTVHVARDSAVTQRFMLGLRVEQDQRVFKAQEIFREAASDLADRLVSTALDPDIDTKEALKAIDSCLDRAGVSRVSKKETEVTENKHTTIEHLRTLAAETLRPTTPTLEAVFHEVSPQLELDLGET